jgi:hypothetical protein
MTGTNTVLYLHELIATMGEDTFVTPPSDYINRMFGSFGEQPGETFYVLPPGIATTGLKTLLQWSSLRAFDSHH